MADENFIYNVTKNNVFQTVNQVRQQSNILNSMEKEGKISIIGGLYNVDTGSVEFYHNFW